MLPDRRLQERSPYWFPAKRYGWGWGPPQTWQGWVVFIVWFAAIFGGQYLLARRRASPVAHVIFVIVMLIPLLLICYWKGEPPRWRWGK